MDAFSLEEAIKAWRKELRKRRQLEPGHVEELESHLRDRIDDLVESGIEAEEAFRRVTAGELEDLDALEDQYRVARRGKKPRKEWEGRSRLFTLMPNFLKITFRNFRRRKGYAFINIMGLAVALAACLLMVLYLRFELSFDRWHDNADRIYRVATSSYHTNGWALGQVLESEYPEVEEAVYLRSESWPVSHQGRHYFDNTLVADGEFLEVFDFPLAEGDPSTALDAPGSVVITEDLRDKYFGDATALGQTLTLRDSLQFTVTGVAENVPDNSHLQFDALVSFESWKQVRPTFENAIDQHWLDLNMYNYVLVRPGTDVDALRDKVRDIYMEKAGDYFRGLNMEPEVRLEPLQDIYLRVNTGNRLGPSSDISYLYLLGGIALFLLIIACINFMNLSTARSLERAKEVGIRKTVGSGRRGLIVQFLTESTLTAFFSMVLAMGLAVWALPLFNHLTQNAFTWGDLFTPAMGVVLLGFVVVVGLLSGLYPAFLLSAFRPVQVLKSGFTSFGKGATLRKGLVVFQFAVTCFLIICTVVVVKQLDYMQSEELGFQKEQVVVMDARRGQSSLSPNQYVTVKQQLASHPAVTQVTSAMATPGRSGWRSILAYGEGQNPDQSLSVEYLPVDFDYIPTFGLELAAGRAFDPERPSDAQSGVVINRAAVEAFGWDSPAEAIGKQVTTINSLLEDPVLGVIENYHHHGLQHNIQPMVMVVEPQYFDYYALRFDAAQGLSGASGMIEHMRSTWEEFFPGYTFNYFFLDEDYATQYNTQSRLAGIYGIFSGLAVFIACMGLFGLVAFTTSRRTKEIGIRKVLGAGISHIIFLISREFLALVGLAFLLASLPAWWFMDRWLQDFAFRTEIGAGVFAVTLLAGVLICLLTVSWQSLRAATMNPVKSLRSE
ncbi:MAG: ABC transporter permease [Balneolaceae bacterium]|nr:ABC transporter permease [Balneolaceae bacterium]